MILTRSDLTIVDTKKDTGLDFHVYIDREDKPMRLTFGILLRGVSSPVTAEQANKVLGPTMGQFQGMRNVHRPRLPVPLHDAGAFFWSLSEPTRSGLNR